MANRIPERLPRQPNLFPQKTGVAAAILPPPRQGGEPLGTIPNEHLFGGEFPALEPGEHFSYNSYHMIRSSRAIAQGSYLGITANGEPVVVGIPSFELVVPGTGEVGYC